MKAVESVERISWHPGFYGGIELELIRYKDILEYETEHQLSKEPLRMDMLIIKKEPGTVIEDEIGRIFRTYNIVEYKSPEDELTQDDFYKTLGYAFLYKGLGRTVNEVPAEEMTVSIFREAHPREMFAALAGQGARIEEAYPGIYYVKGISAVPTQVVVTGQLGETHPVLRALSNRVREEDVRRFIAYVESLRADPGDAENVDAVLQVSISANVDVYERLREEQGMNDVLRAFFQKELDEAKNQGIEQGIERGIEQGIERGIEQGIEQGQAKMLCALVRDGILTLSVGAQRANMSEDAFTEQMNRMYST